MGFELIELLGATPNLIHNNVIITGGLVPRGAYNPSTTYSVGDFISYGGSSYVLYVSATSGTTPTDDTKWMLVAQGA